MTYETILWEVDESLATITLNRPDRMNALNVELAEDLARAIQRCANDPTIRAVIITGAGRGFCAGGDMKRSRPPAGTTGESGRPLVALANEVILGIRNLPKPVIAAINGPAAGAGFNLALACDIRIASDKARFNEAFVKVGLSPDSGGTYLLPRIVGPGKAAELFFTGDFIDAYEAERLGIVNKVVPDDQVAETARVLGLRLAEGATLAIARAKMLLNLGQMNDLATQLNLELENINMSYSTEDHREGVAAFVEKRKPIFKGR